MAQLKEWLKQNWVRIGTDGSIKGPCGTSKDKKKPDRCLPKRKALSLTKAERAASEEDEFFSKIQVKHFEDRER